MDARDRAGGVFSPPCVDAGSSVRLPQFRGTPGEKFGTSNVPHAQLVI